MDDTRQAQYGFFAALQQKSVKIHPIRVIYLSDV